MLEFTFKPATVRKAQTWAIKDDHLMRRGGERAMNLADVTSASWNTVSYRGTRSAWLHLRAGEDLLKIECTDNGGGREAFLSLINAIAMTLTRVNPELEIQEGYSAPWRIALFALGIIGTALGVFFVFIGVTDMAGQGAVQATVAGAALLILMGPVAWTCRPNHKAQSYSAINLAKEIALLGGPPVLNPEDNSGEA